MTIGKRHRARMRYGGGPAITVRGAVTGTAYSFSGVSRVQLVDPRDAVAMSRNAMFRFEGLLEVKDET